ncbi:hypothetical protein EHQ12_12630 [Leptospira gomenensis]|uniref:Uncharacterized protein n=1 Tax=Leptospira gomenensis TaxID=2484974 RepID=A0A5F1YN79_9LEPT|nr:hypothetical protein [Leptospira gomenensis]TGK32775.1 hypothetical protein EHQ17_12475 [Leptospira gomenensis]TGK36923.1 hypothetical protein EHQ12_12630 [Leptospira gomenensis]TGK44394.1 hypothetical protein EHQ07_11945 [Leptospira gomenensis]TGK58887.1 hypothetical protein EHQ13_13765 [Leptospira gomenensis]
MGARFIKTNGAWVDDTSFNQTYLPNMPAWVADQIPGASLSNNVWILTDSTNQLVYQIRMNGTQLTVKNFNIASWMEGGAVAGMTAQNSLSTGTTFLGFQPNIQTSIVTDGHEILRFTPGTSGVEITEIIVPASIPVTSIINWSSGYSQSTSGVTNCGS